MRPIYINKNRSADTKNVNLQDHETALSLFCEINGWDLYPSIVGAISWNILNENYIEAYIFSCFHLDGYQRRCISLQKLHNRSRGAGFRNSLIFVKIFYLYFYI